MRSNLSMSLMKNYFARTNYTLQSLKSRKTVPRKQKNLHYNDCTRRNASHKHKIEHFCIFSGNIIVSKSDYPFCKIRKSINSSMIPVISDSTKLNRTMAILCASQCTPWCLHNVIVGAYIKNLRQM